MSSSPPYRPIACDAHDELLARATFRRPCEITYQEEGGGALTVTDTITDVFSADGAEWLTLSSGARVRLDRLVSVDGIAVTTAGIEPLDSASSSGDGIAHTATVTPRRDA